MDIGVRLKHMGIVNSQEFAYARLLNIIILYLDYGAIRLQMTFASCL